MGKIQITLSGSFGSHQFHDSAMAGGHAAALSRIISVLATFYLPEAIENDHRMHEDGVHPPKAPFGKDEVSYETATPEADSDPRA